MRGEFSSFVVCNCFPAQKHIDNVLDIKEDEVIESTGEEPKMVKSKTMPSMQEAGKRKDLLTDDSVWGSFNGSFFESKPTPSSPITNAPPRKSDTSSGELCNALHQRQLTLAVYF